MTSLADPDDVRALFSIEDDAAHQKVPTYLWEFANDHALLAFAAQEVEHLLRDIAVETTASYHSISARAKTLESYTLKALKKNPDGSRKYDNPAREIQDGIAVRTIVFTLRDREKLLAGLVARTELKGPDNPGDVKRNGYSSEHFIISAFTKDDDNKRYVKLKDYLDKYSGFEVQIRSVAEHAWAEFEHDVRYKSEAYEALSTEDRRRVDQLLVEAGGTRVDIDRRFNEVDALLYPEAHPDEAQHHEPSDDDAEVDVQASGTTRLDALALRGFVEGRYGPKTPSSEEEISELVTHLGAVEISTIEALDSTLADLADGYVARLMKYQTEVAGTRRLDDELLAAIRQRYVDAAANEDRKKILGYRLRRVSGRFNIYAICTNGTQGSMLSGARTVRELTKMVAAKNGNEAAIVNGYSSEDRADLNPSLKPKEVKTRDSSIWVASNLTREAAEYIMRSLVTNAPGSNIRVDRAGDLLVEAPLAGPASEVAGTESGDGDGDDRVTT